MSVLDLKVGDKVYIETSNWGEKDFVENAFIIGMKDDFCLISSDKNTVYSKKGTYLLGWLNINEYIISKI
jgi:hypothetical protein